MAKINMDEEEPFIEKHVATPAQRSSKHCLIPWTLVILLSIYILISTIYDSLRSQSDRLKASDFVPSRSAIRRVQTQFTSSLEFIDPEHIYRVLDPATPLYVGNATKQIDRNWDDLILPADIHITDDEARYLPNDAHLYRSPETGLYKVEIQVFHSLHCLNMMRMRIYADQYPEMLTSNARIHVDHCIESLRELLVCEGNMTPLPIQWSAPGKRINPNYAQRHSCRDFEALKEWTRERVASL